MDKPEQSRKDRYIQFPLNFLQKTFENPTEGFNLIVNFGIMNYALKFEFDITEVGRQLMYAYYRNQKMIQRDLLRAMENYIEDDQLTINDDYNGFSGEHFDPDNESELQAIFNSDKIFRSAAITRYQIAQAAESLDVEIFDIDSVIQGYEKGLKIKDSFELKYGSDSWPSVKPLQVIEFRDSRKDLDLFRAYIGISSMIGQRTFISTNKPAILSRMIGCKSKAVFEQFSKDKNLMPTVEKYSKRYHMDKLLFTLAERGYIMFLSKPKVSVLYLSKWMQPEDLGQLIRDAKSKQDLKKRMKAITASL